MEAPGQLPGLPIPKSGPGCIYIQGWCATDVLLDQCGVHISTSPGKVIKQEIMHRLLRWDCSSGASPKAYWVARSADCARY